MIVKSEFQKTIIKKVSLKGVGLHTGEEVVLSFKPAPVNTGLIFIRTDLNPNVSIPADSQYVTNTDRGTNLENDGAKIQTSEHVLAALVGMGVNNCFIEINSSEPPIMDGSSKFFVESIKKAGLKKQNEYLEEYDNLEDKDITDDYEINIDTFIEETTPRGIVIMNYDNIDNLFVYYTNTKDVPYKYLETVARRFVIINN